jgi:[acyl-carrier-protein] S-malonyltransferase
MNAVWVFPGQGSQAVGMSVGFMDHPLTKHLFDEADATLGFGLTALMRSGDPTTLTLTENAQPALLLAGYAAAFYAQKQSGKPLAAHAAFVAGHSLGEYTALTVAGVFTLAEGLRLVRARGRAMQAAVPAGQGAMVAVLGVPMDTVHKIAAVHGVAVANDNSDGQVVLSGAAAAIEAASTALKDAGAKRVVPLPVSAPFHSPLMAPAAAVMAAELAQVPNRAPLVPVLLNTTAQPATDPAFIKQQLVAQVTGSVRWRESMKTAADAGVTQVVEFGVGKVLAGLAPRCDSRLAAQSLTSPAEVDVFLTSALAAAS